MVHKASPHNTMNHTRPRIKLAVLDDYQGVALEMADWSPLKDSAEVSVFHDTLANASDVIARLLPYDVVCVMRERTPLTRHIISSLPNLKLICSTGPGNAAIDLAAARERGIEVKHTRYSSTATIEYTWALLLALARHVPRENRSLRSGGWQTSVGEELHGKTLGLLGLGNVGSGVARIGLAFGMQVMAWSQNLTREHASSVGASLVGKDDLFAQADYLSIHVRLSERTRGLVGAPELSRMKPASRLINTSRGPVVDEAALITALQQGRLAGAALDVYNTEPLPLDHVFRTLPNLLASPHLGYVSRQMYEVFYGDTVQNIATWLDRMAPAR